MIKLIEEKRDTMVGGVKILQVLAKSREADNFAVELTSNICLSGILLFLLARPHAKFQNPRTTPSERKVKTGRDE